MPFTPTHVLAILPIAVITRLPFPFSALVIGSMIPDLPLFWPLPFGYEATHSVMGLVTACLPLGLVGFLLFQTVMKRPLFALLPAALRRRCVALLGRRPVLNWRGIVWAALAALVGASTHLFWDSFTHQGRWGSHLIPGLARTAVIVQGRAIPGFKLLQYGSTVVGLPCLVLLLAAWLYRQSSSPIEGSPDMGAGSRGAVWIGLFAAPMAMGVLSWRREEWTNYERLGYAITTSGLALTVILLAYCLVYHAVGGWRLRSHGKGGV